MSKPPSDNGRAAVPDQLAPHSVEAEEAVLGSILLDKGALYDVVTFLQPGDFFLVKNEWVYAAILALHKRGEHIDYLTVIEELRNAGRLDELGGAAYITYLINNTPTSLYADTYGRIVERAAVRRRLQRAASEIAMLAQSENQPVDVALDMASALLANVSQVRQLRDLQTARDLLPSVFDRVEAARETGSTGIPTGFADIDRRLGGGLQKGDLVLLAARPGMGKTSWMLCAAMNGMRAQAARPLIFSMEMTAEQLIRRWIAADSGVSTDKMRSGRMTDAEFSAFTTAWAALDGLPFVIDDTSGLTPEQFEAKVARAVAEHGVNVVMVDYLGLMNVPGRSENRTQEISLISRTLKNVARRFDVPVLAASQLNRAVESRQDKRPMLADLRDSGSLEQDADVVLFIYRDDYYNEASDRVNQADIICAKQRNGPTGTDTLYFRKDTTQFSNLIRKEVDLAGY